MNVQLVSIAFDTMAEQQGAIAQYGIQGVPMLIDNSHSVSTSYDVLKWAVGTGEPGHTFILVDDKGQIAWIKDYGSPRLSNPVMWVDPNELVQHIQTNLRSVR